MSPLAILAPADSPAEAASLASAGAAGIYFGYVPAAWLGDHSPLESFNRRSFASAQVTSAADAGGIVREAHAGGARAWATFNQAWYPPPLRAPALEAALELADAGVDGFIVADPGLLGDLRERNAGEVSLSVMAGVFNSRTARVFRRLGASRVTLPREMDTGEILAIAAAVPEATFDVFALFGACPNIEPFCRWVHDDPRRVWPCVKRYTPEPGLTGGRARAAAAQAAWGGMSRAGACGLCALSDLAGAGNVEGLKVVGRGAPTERKLAGVRALRGLLDLLAAGAAREDFLRAARDGQAALSGGCDPRLCLHPEFL